jgi:hypothetical protein
MGGLLRWNDETIPAFGPNQETLIPLGQLEQNPLSGDIHVTFQNNHPDDSWTY